jgi:hypothetical protein
LGNERQALKEALGLMCDVEFVGMEDWGARAAPPLQVCLDEVSRCDLYVGIFANRYGFVDQSSNRSMTEQEYRQAKSQQIPCLIYLQEGSGEGADDPRLAALKAELTRFNTVAFFKTPEKLATKVVVGIHIALKNEAQSGPEDTLVTLLTALLNSEALRRLYAGLGWESDFEAGQSRASQAARLVQIARKSRQTARLLASLTESHQKFDWTLAKPKPDRRRQALIGAGLAAAVLAAAAYLVLPLRFAGKWEDQFEACDEILENAEKADWKDARWERPRNWAVVRGEGDYPRDGALLVRGTQLGVFGGLSRRAWYDFDALLKVRFVRGAKATWAFRTQKDRASGYIFELKQVQNLLMLQGYVRSGGKLRPLSDGDGRLVDIGPCCEPADAFEVRVQARGPEFGFKVILYRFVKSASGKLIPASGASAVIMPVTPPFHDGTFRHGNAGIVQLDPDTQFKMELWCVSAPPGRENGCIPRDE